MTGKGAIGLVDGPLDHDLFPFTGPGRPASYLVTPVEDSPAGQGSPFSTYDSFHNVTSIRRQLSIMYNLRVADRLPFVVRLSYQRHRVESDRALPTRIQKRALTTATGGRKRGSGRAFVEWKVQERLRVDQRGGA